MSATRYEQTQIDFECPDVGRSVKIDRTFMIRTARSGEELGRAISRTDCSDKDKCSVATHRGMGTSYDWNKCAYRKVEQS
jgi:hypothetical protein